MASKKEYLEYLIDLIKDGVVSKSDLETAYLSGTGEDLVSKKDTKTRFSEKVLKFFIYAFCTIGVLIILITAIYFANPWWSSLNSWIKVILGLSVPSLFLIWSIRNFVFNQSLPLGNLMMVISGTLFPLGVINLILESGKPFISNFDSIFVFLVLGLLSLSLFFWLKQNIILSLGIVYLSWSYLSLVLFLIDTYQLVLGFGRLDAYLSTALLLLGLVYLLLIRFFKRTLRRSLIPYLLFFGYVFVVSFIIEISYLFNEQAVYFLVGQLCLLLLGYYFSYKYRSLIIFFVNFLWLINVLGELTMLAFGKWSENFAIFSIPVGIGLILNSILLFLFFKNRNF